LGAHCVINNIFTLLGAHRVIDGTGYFCFTNDTKCAST
jgi:hypothetical protein